jgi:predicted RNase H-like HicB family nuclease
VGHGTLQEAFVKSSNDKASKRRPPRKGRTLKYRVLVEPDEDGIYVAEAPALPGCISQGQTRAAAIRNIKEAIMAYIESLRAHGEAVPPAISEEVVEITM